MPIGAFKLNSISKKIEVSPAIHYNLTSPVYLGASSSTTTQDNVPSALHFSPDGLNMYILGNTNDRIYQYSLSTSWDVTTSSYVRNYLLSSQTTSPAGLTWKPDGTKFYVSGSQDALEYLHEYTVSTAWNISTASYSNNRISVSSEDTDIQDIQFNTTGTIMYILGNSTDYVYQYSLSTAWNISTASYVKSFYIQTQTLYPLSMCISVDGTKMFIGSNNPQIIFQYNLSTAWDIGTASYSNIQFSITGLSDNNSVVGIYFNPDGSRLYKIGTSDDKVYFWNTEI